MTVYLSAKCLLAKSAYGEMSRSEKSYGEKSQNHLKLKKIPSRKLAFGNKQNTFWMYIQYIEAQQLKICLTQQQVIHRTTANERNKVKQTFICALKLMVS